MKNFLKSHTLLLGLTLCLSTTLIFWALTTNTCLRIKSQSVEIEASCNSNIKKAKTQH